MLKGLVDTRRGVLAMTGSDVRPVLQNVVTNDIDLLEPGRAVYAALLTPQGKYLFDFFLLDGASLGWPEDTVLIDCATEQMAALAQRLKMYSLRRDAAVQVAEGMRVALLWDGEPPAEAIPDPRDAALGWRLYTTGDLPEGIQPAGPTDYDVLRVAHLVPESGVELVPDETFILEAGFERLSGVDFRKGCFVGQEVTARMKHKTELRKGLVRVDVSGDAAPGTAITAAGKPAGTLFTVVSGTGLAHLRLDRAGEGMEADGATVSYRG